MADDDRNRQIGEAVRKLRGDLPQDALAATMREHGHEKWSQSTVWSVETGSRPLRLAEAVDLALVLEVDVSDLYLLRGPVAAAYAEVLTCQRRVTELSARLSDAQGELSKAVGRHEHALAERKDAGDDLERMLFPPEGPDNG